MRILLIFWFLHHLVHSSIFDQTTKGKCIPIDIDLCKDLPYNHTYYPNSILNNDQHTLQTHTEHFKPLMKTKCHPHIHFFICSVFAPMCPTSLPQAVTSCRTVCEQVKADCVSILEEFGIGWPEPLNCSKFPDAPNLCMQPSESEVRDGSSTLLSSSTSLTPSGCPSDLIDVDPHDSKAPCAFACNANVMFSFDHKKFARTWSVWFAIANSLAALISFLTFVIDTKRFRFPERCVFYISICVFFSSIPSILPLIADSSQRSCHRSVNGKSYLSVGTFDNMFCLVSFLLNYFFSLAAQLWWLMFSFTLYLSGGRKWVPEGIEAFSSYVHFVAWGLSSIATIIVLIFNKVDASELTALCSVGNLNDKSLLLFVILPKTCSIVIGTCFIIGAFSSMCRERVSFRRRGTDTSKLETLMLKMSIFCALFVIPIVIEMVCQSYSFLILTQWTKNTIECKSNASVCPRPHKPQGDIYIVSLLSSLVAGFACLMWILSIKTIKSWKRFVLCGCCSNSSKKSTTEPSSRPLLEPPTAPPPQPPQVYVQMSTQNSQNTWRPSKIV